MANTISNIPNFLVKVWKLVNNSNWDDVISWNEDGNSFIIYDQTYFAKEILPSFFKHNNMASFVRQLNMYGFHKVTSFDSGTLKSERDELEFAHSFFIRDQPYLLSQIKRKATKTQPPPVQPETTPECSTGDDSNQLFKVFSEIKLLKEKQQTWDARLLAMKRENEALWRELALFRQKHMKQEQIINKLIHFIVTIVQPGSRGMAMRRRYPLMLSDSPPTFKKFKKFQNTSEAGVRRRNATGPTIHEIDPADVLFETENDTIAEADRASNSSGFVMSPGSSTSNPQAEVDEEWLEMDTEDINPLTPVDPSVVHPQPTLKVASSTTSRSAGRRGRLSVNARLRKQALPRVRQQAAGVPTASTSSQMQPGNTSRLRRNMSSKRCAALLNRISNIDDQLTPASPEDLLKLVVETEHDPNDLSTIDMRDMFDHTVVGGKRQEGKRINKGKRMAAKKAFVKGKRAKDFLETYVPSPSLVKQTDSQHTENQEELNTFNPPKALTLEDSNSIMESDHDPTLGSMAVVCQSNTPNGVTRELENHVENVQSGLDGFKELLSNENYSFDANALLGVCPTTFAELPSFSSQDYHYGLDFDAVRKLFDDPLAYNMPPPDSDPNQSKENGIGNELMTYSSPTLLDLLDSSSASNLSISDWSLPNVEESSELTTPVATPLSAPEFSTPPGGKRRRM